MTSPRYHDRPPRVGPVPMWALSRWLFRRGRFRTAKAVKGVNFFLWRALLPPEAEVGRNVRLEHYAMGVGFHPNTTIGDDVRVYQDAQLGSLAEIGGPDRIVVEADVVIGMGAKIVNSPGHTLVIGRGSRIGAHAIVTRSVPPYSVVRAAPSQVSPRRDVDASGASVDRTGQNPQ